MTHSIRSFLTSALCVTLPAFAMAQEVSPEDFVGKAARSNLFEIQSSEQALDHAQGSEVREFAETMIADHTKAGDALKQAAGSIEVPTEMSAEQAAKVETLKGMRGGDFDATYIDMQTAAHAEAVALFTAFAASAADGLLKQFAVETLPTLQQHQNAVKQLATAN